MHRRRYSAANNRLQATCTGCVQPQLASVDVQRKLCSRWKAGTKTNAYLAISGNVLFTSFSMSKATSSGRACPCARIDATTRDPPASTHISYSECSSVHDCMTREVHFADHCGARKWSGPSHTWLGMTAPPSSPSCVCAALTAWTQQESGQPMFAAAAPATAPALIMYPS